MSLLNLTALSPVFQAPGTYTVFAPTNVAFAAMPTALVGWLTNARTINRDALTNTLKYHMLGTVVTSSAIPAGGVALNTLCTT